MRRMLSGYGLQSRPMDDLPPSERRPYSVADRTGQLRCSGGADDSILSVYRAIMLSLAGNACPISRWCTQCVCIPSEIPSCNGVCGETSLDSGTPRVALPHQRSNADRPGANRSHGPRPDRWRRNTASITLSFIWALERSKASLAGRELYRN